MQALSWYAETLADYAAIRRWMTVCEIDHRQLIVDDSRKDTGLWYRLSLTDEEYTAFLIVFGDRIERMTYFMSVDLTKNT